MSEWSEWVDSGEICSSCDYNGAHLHIDDGENGKMIFCGQCNQKL